MPWVVLLASAVLEAVWATALGRSDGLTEPVPTAVFAVALVGSMVGLARASRTIPIGVGYAVWVGVGAALTVGFGIVAGGEPASPARIALLAGIVVCVAGLHHAGSRAAPTSGGPDERVSPAPSSAPRSRPEPPRAPARPRDGVPAPGAPRRDGR